MDTKTATNFIGMVLRSQEYGNRKEVLDFFREYVGRRNCESRTVAYQKY